MAMLKTNCPFCKDENAYISYEENRVYKLQCLRCRNEILHRDISFDSATKFFRSLKIEKME